MIITTAATGIFSALKAAKVKPSKASLDVMDNMKLAGGICGGVLLKDYIVYMKWINESCNKSTRNGCNKKFYGPIKAIKLYVTKCCGLDL